MRTGRIGRYEVIQPLAIGSFGDVLLARSIGLGGFERHVVLKTHQLAETDDEQSVAQFLDEARVLGALHHHHIAPIYEVGREGDVVYLVIDYVHGQTAHDVMQRTLELGAALPLDFALTVVSAAASALHYAHTRRGRDGRPLGIVHRDVSLINVMIGFDGGVKLIDFGIAFATDRAARTEVGFVKGNAGYMAPEQIRGRTVDARTDVFALGTVLYELTTMTRAFRESSEQATMEKIASGALVKPTKVIPDYPVELERIVLRALAVSPKDRYPTAEAMRRELEALGHGLGLVLGDAAVSEVMTQLFDDRREPWRRAPSRAETDSSAASVPEAIAEDDADVTSPTVLANQPPRRGPLRTATQAVDSLIQELDTPARGTLLESAKKKAAVPIAINQADTGAVTMIAGEPQPDTGAIATTVAPVPTRPSVPPAAAIAVAAAASSSLPPARPRHPRAATRAQRRTRVLLAIVVVAAVSVGTSLALLRTDHSSAPPPPAHSDAAIDARPIDAAPPPPDAAIDAPVDASTTIKFTITSIPSEATVLIDGKRLGKTPYETTVDRDAATHVVKLRRRGYASVRFETTFDADLVREIRLTKSESADAP
jgi:eukaryotic-like serine/threonine-protein kinase